MVDKLLKAAAAEWEEDSHPAQNAREASHRGAKIGGVALVEAILALRKVTQGPLVGG